MATKQLAALLAQNPKAKREEKLIRQTLRDLRKLRDAGIVSDGYSLLPPFGEKGHLSPSVTGRNRRSILISDSN